MPRTLEAIIQNYRELSTKVADNQLMIWELEISQQRIRDALVLLKQEHTEALAVEQAIKEAVKLKDENGAAIGPEGGSKATSERGEERSGTGLISKARSRGRPRLTPKAS